MLSQQSGYSTRTWENFIVKGAVMAERILCVEDNPQNMRLVRKILTGAGYEVLEAVDGTSGLHAVLNCNVNLVLMDVNLPDIDGLEVTRRVREQEGFEQLPIIALTANAMHGDKERCLEAGCNGYVPKPITKSELLGTVAQFLKKAARASQMMQAVSPIQAATQAATNDSQTG